MKKLRSRSPLFAVIFLAMLSALAVVLGRFLSINTFLFKIETAFIAVAVAGYYFGPIGGAVVAGLGDFLGAILFPTGAYFFPFTLSALLTGAWFGIALRGNFRLSKAFLAVLPTQIVCSLGLNTWFISMISTKEILDILLTLRLPQVAAMIPLQILVIWLLGKQVFPRLPIER